MGDGEMDLGQVIAHIDTRISEVKTDMKEHIQTVRTDVESIKSDVKILMAFKWKVTGIGILVGSGTAVVYQLASLAIEFLKRKIGS